MSDHFQLARGSVGEPNRVNIERDDLPGIDAMRLDAAGLFSFALAHRRKLWVMDGQVAKGQTGKRLANDLSITHNHRLQLVRMQV